MKKEEWPTLILIFACYGVWAGLLFSGLAWWVVVPLIALTITLQSSLQHEVIHGHPFNAQWLNEVLVHPSLNLFIPFLRFRDTHLAHHKNEHLTDPYDDPETNFLTQAGWDALCQHRQPMMRLNNTLLGRMILGPIIGQIYFMLGDWRALNSGDGSVCRAWVWQIITTLPILWLVWVSPLSMGAYLAAAYLGLMILKIRTFAEHQAHEKVGPRTIVIEDRGPLAFLFLNNNFHMVHHMHPRVPWYQLPALYFARRSRFLQRNQDYVLPSYRSLFAKYLFRAKDPVVHPHWQPPE